MEDEFEVAAELRAQTLNLHLVSGYSDSPARENCSGHAQSQEMAIGGKVTHCIMILLDSGQNKPYLL
jgi:hypothetical protein